MYLRYPNTPHRHPPRERFPVPPVTQQQRIQPPRALSRRRDRLACPQDIVVKGCVRPVRCQYPVQVPQLGEADRRRDVVHVELVTPLTDVRLNPGIGLICFSVDAIPAQQLPAPVIVRVAGGEDPAVDRRDVLDRLQRETRKVSERAANRFADFTCFSLQAIKHITTIDGGILATRDPDDYRRGKLLRWYGIDREADQADARIEADIGEWGYKFHMNDVAATIGLAQLGHLDRVLAAHRANAAFYDDVLGARQPVPAAAKGAWWLYTLLLRDRWNREAFTGWMTMRGIRVSQVHARHRHPPRERFPVPPVKIGRAHV